MTSPFLRLAEVTRRFGGQGGVERVSLEVALGESVVVIGPSGSGKTTLLRLVSGLERPDQGEIWLDGVKVAESGRTIVPPHQRQVGFVFQDLALWPHLTAFENVAFALRSTNTAKEQRRTRVNDLLQLCRVDLPLANRYPHQLSGGEQQRVALARALGGRPRLLLLDEPFSGLDPKLRSGLRTELTSLRRQLHLTAIYVTHDREDAEVLADRILTMQGVTNA